MGQAGMASAQPVRPQGPLWHPRRLAQLYFQPAQFFAPERQLDEWPTVLYVMWAVGVVASLDRMEAQVVRGELAPGTPGFPPSLANSWLLAWILLLVVGGLSGLLLWIVGGWWYRVRLRWAGTQAVDSHEARLTYAFVKLVAALPTLFVLALATVRYPNFLAAAQTTSVLDILPPVFIVWGLVVSYVAVRARFQIGTGGAFVWFLLLPVVFYIVGFVLLGMLMAGLGATTPTAAAAA